MRHLLDWLPTLALANFSVQKANSNYLMGKKKSVSALLWSPHTPNT